MKIKDFSNQRLKWNALLFMLAFLLSILSVITAFGQTVKILKGKVTDLDGKPLRATVRHSGGAIVTDPDGSFLIKGLVTGDTIRFTQVGFKTVFRIYNQTEIFMGIKMSEENYQLEDVVVQTGYQTSKPNEINGAVSVIDEKVLNARSGTSILDRIVGQTSGLVLQVGKTNSNPQNSTNITIRGLGTINGPLDPLIILDGFIYEGDINNINPNDVENVTVLKDAASASIWGARAGNGVIVITTKKGKLNQPIQISFNANYLYQGLPNLSAIPEMENTDYIALEKKLFDAGYFNDRISTTPWAALTPAVEIFLAQRDGKISPSRANEQIQNLIQQGTVKSYLDNFYTQALTQQYSLNIKGGGERNSYLVSASYDRSKGETYNTSDKLNLHLANDFKIIKNLDLSTNVYFTNVKSKSGRPSYNTLSVGSRYPPYLDFNASPSLNTVYRGAYTDTLAKGKLQDWKYYPTDEYKHNYIERKVQELYGNLSLRYRIIDGLNLQLSYQFQRQTADDVQTMDSESFAARNLVNTYSQYNPTTGVVTYIVPKGGILKKTNAVTNSQTGRAQFNYYKIFGFHSLTAIMGGESRSSSLTGESIRRLGYLEDPLYFSYVDEIGDYPQFLNGNYGQIGGDNSQSKTEYRFLSLYANMAYSYKGRYTLSGSIRRDGSNIFGASTNDKWKPLWSTGLGWKVSQEGFYNMDWLPVLTFTTTFGYSGNVDLSKTAYPIASYGVNSATGLPLTRISSINNPNLRWEQLSQLNFKLDFEINRQRLTGSIAYYLKRGTDLYGRAPFDYTAWGGSNQLVRNVADMIGKGLDIDLHSKNIKSAAFNWETDVFFSYNSSKTKKYYRQSGSNLGAIIGGSNSITPLEGYPLYSISTYKWGGLDGNGNPQGYLNGALSTNYNAILQEAATIGDNVEYSGPSSPTYFGSIINTIRIKSLSLSFNLNYKLGYKLIKPSFSTSQFLNTGIGYADYALRWQNPGDELKTNVPSFLYPQNSSRDGFYQMSSINVISGNHVRLDYIRLSYDVNSSQWKFPFRNLEIYAAAQNVGIIWKANNEGIDPDYPSYIPPTRQFIFGIRGSF